MKTIFLHFKPNNAIGLLSLPLIVGGALLSASTAQAELVIHTSRDDAGRTSMVVTDDAQTDLPPAQLGISPSRVDETVSLTEGKNLSALNQSFTIYNYGNKPKSISLDLVDLDGTGTPVAPSETTLKPYTLINPTQFTIPVGGYQTVRMAIRLPMQFAQGSYKSMLTIEQQVDDAVTYDEDGRGVTIELGSRYGLPVNIEVQ